MGLWPRGSRARVHVLMYRKMYIGGDQIAYIPAGTALMRHGAHELHARRAGALAGVVGRAS